MARLFFAIPVPQSTQQAISVWRQKQMQSGTAMWVPEANFHITLAFIGNKSRQDIPDIIEYANRSLDLGLLPFRWRLNRVSHFREGVVYLGGWNTPLELTHFANALALLVPSNAQHPNFIPHITLARHSPRLSPLEVDILMHAEQIVLYESITTDNGTHYNVVHRWLR